MNFPGQVRFHTKSLSVFDNVPFGQDPVRFVRNCTPMPLHAEELIDREVQTNALEELALVKWLYGRKLTFNLNDWYGTLFLRWQKISQGGNPVFSMDPMARGEAFGVDLDLDSLPIYCITCPFDIPGRLMAEWARFGQALDLTMVAQAVTATNEAVELSLLEGPPITVDGHSVPGMLNSASQVAFVDHTSWTDAGKTGPEILTDLKEGVTSLKDNKVYPPYVLTVGTDYSTRLNDDYNPGTSDSRTIRQRILDREDISDIVTVNKLADDNIMLFQPNRKWVDLIVGQQPAVVSWIEGPAEYGVRHYMVVACVIPRIRDTYDGQTGITVMKPTL